MSTSTDFLKKNGTCADKGILSVFIAERQLALREALAQCFENRAGLQVVGGSGDGSRTLDACFQLKPRVVLLSTDLAGLSGVEVCRTLSAANVGVNILVMAADCEDRTIMRYIEKGALGVVETTASLATLMQAAEVVGQGRAFFGEKITHLVREVLQGGGPRQRDGELSAREHEVLRLIAEGFSNKEIAAQLGICAKTVENHRSHLMRKLRAHNGADLTREAFRLGVVKTNDPFPKVTFAGLR
ncbi:MAG: response regulator transcription factor [Nibricoccus sp.]